MDGGGGGLDLLGEDGSAWERLHAALILECILHLFGSNDDACGDGGRPVRSAATAVGQGSWAGEAAAIAPCGWGRG